MRGSKWLRPLSLLTLFFFAFFIGTADYSYAQQESDKLDKARQLYQQGDYEGSIKMLSDFIQKLRAMVEQKKNVAEAFYLLAKIYFEVGDDTKVEENLRKCFQTYPALKVSEPNFSFKERVEKIRQEVLQAKESEVDQQQTDVQRQEQELKAETETPPQVIQQPTYKKKKKKFPMLLVIGGVVVVAAVVVLLLAKKGEDKFDIRGRWTVYDTQTSNDILWENINFNGEIESGTFVDGAGDAGRYTVTDNRVNFNYNEFNISFTGNASDDNNMSGTWTSILGTRGWRAQKGAGAAGAASAVPPIFSAEAKSQSRK